jgi:hypothetical protein
MLAAANVVGGPLVTVVLGLIELRGSVTGVGSDGGGDGCGGFDVVSAVPAAASAVFCSLGASTTGARTGFGEVSEESVLLEGTFLGAGRV